MKESIKKYEKKKCGFPNVRSLMIVSVRSVYSASQHLLVTSFLRGSFKGKKFNLIFFDIFFETKLIQKMIIYIIFSFFPMVFHFFAAKQYE